MIRAAQGLQRPAPGLARLTLYATANRLGVNLIAKRLQRPE